MPDTELDITSLLARISQLEERQNIVSKYMVGLKRQFDRMTEVLQQIEPLREQVSELQQRFEQLPILTNSLDDVQTSNAVAEYVSVDDAETVKQFFERDEETNVARQEQSYTVLSDEEFKIERILLLLGAYADEEESQEVAISAEEFWRRYEAGERNFTEVNLAGANLSGQWLSSVNLSRANLVQARLSRCYLN